MGTRLVTLNGSAAAWTDSLNLTDYIGGLAVFTDSAGKKLWGYIKEADIAEALGGEETLGTLDIGSLYKITGGYENFLGYAETDGPGKVTVAANTITLTDGDRDEDYYVTKDFGAGYFGDFTHWVDVNVTAITADGNSSFYFDAVTNAAIDLYVIDAAFGDCIFLGVGRVSGGYRVGIYNVDGGALTISTGGTTNTVGDPIYISSSRVGTDLTVEVYSTAALRVAGGAGDVDTITHTVVATTFQFVYGLASYNHGTTAKDISGTVSNLALKQFADDGSPSQDVDTYFNAISGTVTLDATYKVREVTNLSIDAALIVSTFNGVTQNWTGMDGGFDPNDPGIALIVVLPFSIIRHPHFIVVKNLYSGAGGNIDVDHHLLFKGSSRSQGVKVKRISFAAGYPGDFVVIKEGDENGPEITRLGSGDAWVPDNCYFKDGGSVMKPFIDVSACTLYGWTENRIIFDFTN